eukprot:TRINITY_DN3113_c0_g1_i1.p1 TRINITY_DN3113_c0_g1~~TRINITY_DN3113_c0_g1_i1.p1  ORF type:complete len:687 (-),score=58.05 TRINITY_DN3113_c0_g1_i1:15-2075(-)
MIGVYCLILLLQSVFAAPSRDRGSHERGHYRGDRVPYQRPPWKEIRGEHRDSNDRFHDHGDHRPQSSWRPLNHQPEFLSYEYPGAPPDEGGVNNPKQLTDGSILVQNLGWWATGEIWKLTPDSYGSYVNGTWSQLASLPDGYSPYGFGSAVLADGRVVFIGGEYTEWTFNATWSNLGAIYDPIADEWAPLPAPDYFLGAGDCATVVLEDGTLMVQDALSSISALLDPKTLTWTRTGGGKYDRNDEEGWVLLPNGQVLTVDASGIAMVYVTIETDQPGVGPFEGIASQESINNNLPPPTNALGAIPSPDPTACTGNLTTMSGKVAVYIRACPSPTSLPNIEEAGAIAAIQISDGGPIQPVIGDPSSGIHLCSVSSATGEALQAAILEHPDIKITIKQLSTPPHIQRNSEIYDPKTGRWRSAGNTIVELSDPEHQEQGPLILRPDGTVVAFGGIYGYTAIYDTKKMKWRAGPKFPLDPVGNQIGMADGSAALLPNGNILVSATVGYYESSAYIFQFDGSKFIPEPLFPNAYFMPGPVLEFMVLPTGQVMSVDNTNDVQIYTPADTSFRSEWSPVIYDYPEEVRAGHTYAIEGIRFNGMSQGSLYGDDYQGATNFPLVRITNKRSRCVFYCRTHDHNFMGVASQRIVKTYFDVLKAEEGESLLEVVANGIPSLPVTIFVLPHKPTSHSH